MSIRTFSRCAAALCLGFTVIGCGTTVTTQDQDAGVVDGAAPDTAAPDAAMPDGPMPDAPPPQPSAQSLSAGGGAATSAGYRLQVQIGAPQPMGTASSANYRMRLGTVEH